MTPFFTSFQRTSPGRIGRPAASALVHVLGRRWFESRLQVAPEPARQPDAVLRAAKSSKRRQWPRSTISMCASEPRSIFGCFGNRVADVVGLESG